MPNSAATYRILLRDEADGLLADFARLADTDWSRPTACAGWDVLDVLIHLHLGTVLHVNMLRDGLAGRFQPPWDLPPGADPSATFRQRHQQGRLDGPGPHVEGFRAAVADYDQVMAEVDDAALDRPAWFWSGQAPLRTLIAARAFDHVIHRADIRRAVGWQPWFTPAGGRQAGELATRSAELFSLPDRLVGVQGAVLQTIDGVSTQAYVADGRVRIAPPDGRHQAAITTDGGTWALVTWGRLALTDALAQRLVTVEGDHTLAERYLGAIRTP